MSQQFLEAADKVLQSVGRPLRVRDIVQKALDEGFLQTKGKTPIDTMRARVSEHIRLLGNDSLFIRVEPNKIALRKWDYQEFKAKRFEKQNNDEELVCITQESLDKAGRFFGFTPEVEKYAKILSNPNNLAIEKKINAKKRFDIKQLVSYVLLTDKQNRILSYRRGNYGNKESLLKGVLCVGFGGHVNREDIDLFDVNYAGIRNSAYREIFEEIKGLRMNEISLIGAINDDSSPLGLNHFAFVFKATLPDGFDEKVSSSELSINQVKLVDIDELWDKFHELEFWSQLLLKHYIDKERTQKLGFFKSKRKHFLSNPLVINGEIGCGKTEVSKYFQDNYNAVVISTRACVCEILKIDDFGVGDRSEFQAKAMALVSRENGITTLANLISDKILAQEANFVIIDGIRNIETFNLIKKRIPNINLMYIENPRDVAFNFYKDRSKPRNVTLNEFRDVRHREVEKEILLFKDLADVYVYNGESIQYLYKILNKWIKDSNIHE
jgi:predicted NUDIX family phosphoesterase/dephospho-CoA kinase